MSGNRIRSGKSFGRLSPVAIAVTIALLLGLALARPEVESLTGQE
jgi:hypothetical protein